MHLPTRRRGEGEEKGEDKGEEKGEGRSEAHAGGSSWQFWDQAVLGHTGQGLGLGTGLRLAHPSLLCHANCALAPAAADLQDMLARLQIGARDHCIDLGVAGVLERGLREGEGKGEGRGLRAAD